MDEIKKGQELIVFLTKIYEEAFSVQKERRKKYEEYTSYYHGQIWPKDSHRLKIVINHLKEIITRKVSLMTDVIPVIELLPSDERLFPVAEALKKVITALWEEYSWSDTLQELIYFNQLYGSAFTNTCWDPALDWGKGDINIIVGDPRSYLIDPFITRANKINEAEYIIYEYFKPTEQLRAQYPDAAEEIKSYYEIEKEKKGFMDRILKTLKFRTESGFRPTIERSLVKEYWIKDRTVQNDKAVYPAGRFIKLVGNTILDDEPNIYWDGRFPIDMIDWQFDPDSPFGISEVEDLATPFKVYNNILSLIVENTVLSVNTIWTGDIDSLPPGEREKLLRNKPGEFIGHRPGKPIVRQPPPPLPAYLMANVEYLRSMLDEVSGMAEVTRGKRGGLCVDTETECLTKRGWKKYNELRKEDELYCLDPIKKVGVWSPLLNIVTYEWNDNLIKVKTKRMDCLVTPNHGWLVGSANDTHNKDVKYRSPRRNQIHWHETQYQRVEMKDINMTHYIPNDVGLSREYKGSSFTDEFIELIGWIVTEGSYYIGQRKNRKALRNTISITQSYQKNEDYCKMIEDCLKKNKIHFSKYNNKKTGVRRFNIEGNIAKKIMQMFPLKRLGFDFISSIPREQVDILYKTMLRGDGTDADGKGRGSRYFSADRELAEQFQMVAVLSGKATRLKNHPPDPRTKSHKRLVFGNLNSVICRRDRRTKWRTLLKYIKEQHYKGIVWCPETAIGTWLARRDGITYLTHNTSASALEGAFLASQSIIRYQARKLENLISRIGQKLIARILQFFTDDRLMFITGPEGRDQFHFVRNEIIKPFQDVYAREINGIPSEQIPTYLARRAFRDFQFKVIAGSSLAMTKTQRAMLAMTLFKLGIIDDESVLDILEFPNKKAILYRKRTGKGEAPPPRSKVKLPVMRTDRGLPSRKGMGFGL